MIRMLVTGGSGFIGTNLIDTLIDRDVQFLNLDINPPKKAIHEPYWQECDILDFDLTMRRFEKFQPTHVIHLAARTDTLSNSLDDYKVNTEGTTNILRCIKAMPGFQRVIITSSQFVFAPPGLPTDDEDYNPIGAYGLSKVLSEKATRLAGLDCVWTITRPTNIWGPWHPRYPREFWLVLRKGFYFHPSGKPVMRSYGYVKNIVYQMMEILDAAPVLVDKKVYYLGDPPIPITDWVNGFSLLITGRPVRIVPKRLLWILAAAGTFLKWIGIRFPITLSRYRSMTENYFSPVETTISDLGRPPYSLDEGIKETVDWLTLYWNKNLS
ncbi:MAG: NAD(P)-dependent oxidoreductase [Anaerolineales bacterium]|nr:NAD(P)-dependent oxidoreductase [Anaerolineales bacterium]